MCLKMVGKKLSAFEKKIPENPMFKSVTAKVNSNNTKVTFVPEKVIVKRRDEIFTRVSPRGLMDEISLIDLGDESIYNLPKFDDGSSVITSMNTESNQSGASNLLILDIRSADDFRVGHIKGAVSYPMQLLMRDKITSLLHKFRDPEGKIFVVYGNDDRQSVQGAETYVLKGWPGVYCLSGGFDSFAAVAGRDFVTGQMPALSKENLTLIHGGAPSVVKGSTIGNGTCLRLNVNRDSDALSARSSVVSHVNNNQRLNSDFGNKLISNQNNVKVNNYKYDENSIIKSSFQQRALDAALRQDDTLPSHSRASSVATSASRCRSHGPGGSRSGTRLAWAGAAALSTNRPGLGGTSKRFV